MLASSRVSALIPVVDLDGAKKFYEEKLGLQRSGEPGPGVTFTCGQGTLLSLYPRATPTIADHTAAGWLVDNIEEAVEELLARGVVFEQYDMPGLKTDEQGIAGEGSNRGAWFKDPEGNILGIFQDG